jgi:uncharacterized membrane protein YraQ (UPF0718 family)
MMRDRKPDWTTLTVSGVALLLTAVVWARGGSGLVLEGLTVGVRELINVTPLLLSAFLVAGLTRTLISRDMVRRGLGSRAGWRGILIACIGGALIPGGPYVYYPVAGALLHSGAGLGVLIAFVTAKNLWSVSRLPYEFALLGSQLTLIRYLLTLAIPPIAGFLAEFFFGGLIHRIRETAQ